MAANISTYTKQVKSVAQYTKMRGVTDFSNAQQFNVFEGGFSFLFIISRPKFIEKLGDDSDLGGLQVKELLKAFCYILEYEFKGLDGLDDLTADPIEVTDGISTLNLMGKVTKQSSAEVSMTFTEKSGSTITKFLNYYMSGIRDPRTQAKTYHGLVSKENGLAPGLENEVFNFLYVVTDNTMLQVEKAFLLCNAYPTKAPFSTLYNTTKGDIDKKEVDVTFQCFVIDGPEVDKRALRLLDSINTVNAVYNTAENYGKTKGKGVADAVNNSDLGTVAKADQPIQLKSDSFEYDALINTEGQYSQAGKWAAESTSTTTTTTTTNG